MKLTADMLRQIIKEETQRAMDEGGMSDSRKPKFSPHLTSYVRSLLVDAVKEYGKSAKMPSPKEMKEFIQSICGMVEDFAAEKVEETLEDMGLSGGVGGFEDDEEEDSEDDDDSEDEDEEDEDLEEATFGTLGGGAIGYDPFDTSRRNMGSLPGTPLSGGGTPEHELVAQRERERAAEKKK